MTTAVSPPPGQIIGSADQRVILHGVPWSHYEILLAIKGEAAVREYLAALDRT